MEKQQKIIVIGVSAGGAHTLPLIFKELPKDFPLPIAVVQHLHPNQNRQYIEYYSFGVALHVIEAHDKQLITPGHIYFAPPDYHLLIERDMTFSLTADEKVNFSRPAIDVLFASASHSLGESAIAVLLSGSNNDGAEGCKIIKKNGGKVIVQSPESCNHPYMPQSALKIMIPDLIATPTEICSYLLESV